MNFSGHVNSECQITFIKQTERKRVVITKLFFSNIPGLRWRRNNSVTNMEEFYEA